MTARMIPSLDPVKIDDDGERMVYVALRDQLPDDWTVFYHYTYCVRTAWRLVDGEADFIVVAPGRGLMFLEVKLSYGYACVEGKWYRIKRDGSREEAENPFDQAMKNKHHVVKNVLCRGLNVTPDRFQGTYGHAVIYPRAKVRGALCRSQDPQVVINYFDMPYLLDRVEKAYQDWGSGGNGPAFTAAYARRVVEILRGDTEFVTVAAAEADDADARIEALTREQYDTFRGVLARNRVRVLGGAGSGKTMLAVWTAQTLASLGDSVLFLCFNRLLASWLTQRYDLPPNVKVSRFHALCREYARQAGIPFNPPSPDDDSAQLFWAEQSPILLGAAEGVLGDACRFDSILIDEAQDFHQDWWIPLQLLMRDPERGHFYLFYDPDQAGPYGRGQAYPSDVKHVCELTQNCRNTKRIASYCGSVIEKPIESFGLAPEGVTPALLAAQPDPGQRAATARGVVNGWLGEGFQPSRIAVLSPWRRGNPASVLTGVTSVANYPVCGEDTDLARWMRGECLWGSTVKAFKGLEADCILLADVPPVDVAGFSRSELYVAASRAKLNLALLPSSAVAHGELGRWLGGASV